MNENQIDHDRLFKELLETFFAEFMELFFPEASRAIDLTQLEFLQQELFTDVTAGEKHKVDILVETRLKTLTFPPGSSLPFRHFPELFWCIPQGVVLRCSPTLTICGKRPASTAKTCCGKQVICFP